MPTPTSFAPRWSTSSLGEPATPSEQDKRALVDHLCLCSTQRGPLQTLGVGVQYVESVVGDHAACVGMLSLVLSA